MIPRNLVITIVILLVALLGMGLYGWHLRRQAIELLKTSADTKPVAPPPSGSTEQITIFIPDDDHGDLIRRQVSAALPAEPTLRAKEIVRVLITQWQEKDSTHPLGNNADVKEVFLLNNDKTAVVDVNGAFADQHRSGVLVEELTMAALARTLGANLNGIEDMKLLVDGRERETLAGHADLREFYPTNIEWHVE
ncbi:MAG TPA: GerMN domain-containing protein [Terriglobales bacterium]|nr:GerMN domain-containing protein [Terriglobales bacterium]